MKNVATARRKFSLVRELLEATLLIEQEQQNLFWMSTRLCRKIEKLPERLPVPAVSEAHFLRMNAAVSALNLSMTTLKEHLHLSKPAQRKRPKAPVLSLVRPGKQAP